MDKKNRIISDAPESNAGDDFHVLWSMRKSLELLNTDESAIKAITLEGVLPTEAKKFDPTGFLFLGVDITEYFGGENFQEANSVVFSQLKYSTRQVDKDWTLNAISKTNKSKKYPFSGSIINRLSTIFSTYLNAYDRDIVLKKIQLKLVSNRNVSNEVTTLINDVQKYLYDTKSPSLTKLKSKLTKHSQGIELLENASMLKVDDFIDFLKVLDFSDCGTDSRFVQKQKTIETIVKFTGVSGSQFAELNVFVRDKMMPENRNNNLITEKDILSIFGFGQVKDLFPAPSQIEICKNYIYRKCFTELRDNIVNNKNNKFYLHAGAGYGKSTFVSNITKSLPKGSKSIIFDCYGGGTYSDPSDKRHKHQWGILQIASEMAIKIGTSFLLMQNGIPEQYLRELNKRLKQGINILRAQNSEAILLLIIDAADNSLTAANSINEKSFVADLIQETLPEGCKLLITTRTSRKDLFEFPINEFIPLQIEPFDIEETTTYLKSIRSEVSCEFINTFHKLTNGIPRVQSYALRTKEVDLEEILSPLRPDGKNLNDIFADQIKTASRRLGKQNEAKTVLKYLSNLPRPIPLSILTLISGVKQDVVIDFIVDLHPGLILSDEQVSFKDEDFETYLKDSYLFNDHDYEIVANNMLEVADENKYCCINLAHFLLQSNNADLLQQIVLQQTHISAVSEPLQQKQLIFERTRLALKSANKETDKANFIRLQLLAAETAKTNATLNSIIIENADLVALYGISENSKENYSFKHSWYGAYYASKAAALSRKPQFQDQAKIYLKEADSWFHWCSRQKKEDYSNRNFGIKVEDIKNATEAYLNIYGVDEAIKYISSWKPKEIVFLSIKALVHSILDQKKPEIIFELLKRNDIHFSIKLLLIQCLLEYGIIPNNIDFDKIITTISGYKEKLNETLKELLITFCELLAFKKQEKQTILKLLQMFGDCTPKYVPRFYQSEYYNDKKEAILFDISCRVKSLIAVLSNTIVTTDDFLPEIVKEKLTSKEYDERKYTEDQKREFNRLYGFALPYYKLRIETILGLISQNDFKTTSDTILRQAKENWELRHYHHYIMGIFDFIACRFLDIIPLVSDKEHLLNQIHNSFLYSKESKKTHILITTVDRISKINTDETNKLALRFCNQADEIIRNDLLTLEDINNYYIKATRALNRIDISLGRIFFQKIIEAVNKIDDNAYHQIRAIHSISQIGLPQPLPELAFEFGRFVEYTKTILSGYENFPMEEALCAIANIDQSSSLAFLCRWDHRKILELDSYAVKNFNKLNEVDFIDGVYNAALWPLSPYFNFDSPFFQSLEKNLIDFTKQNLIKEKRIYINQLIRDIKLESHINWRKSYLNQLKDVLKTNNIDIEILSDLNDYIQKIHTLKPEESCTSSFKPDEVNEFDWESFTKEIDFLKLEDMENALLKIKKEKDDFCYNATFDFIIYISKKCLLMQQVSFFEIICKIHPHLIGYYNFESIIKKLIEEWEDNYLLIKWVKDNFEKIFKTWLPYFLEKYNDSLTYYFYNLAETFGIKNKELAPIVINALPDIVSNLNSEQLYRLIEITKIGLTKEDCQTIMQETIKKWNQTIKNDFADGPFSNEMIPTRSSNEAIANVFRYVLGHPDKQMRWRGAHALRRLIIYNPRQSILKFLIQNQNNETCIPFQNKDYIFFWMSSKLYLWMVINRIANEDPCKLKAVMQEIINEAINPSQSHLLIQLFVKRTCSILCKACIVENRENILKEIEKPFINDIQETLPNITIDSHNWRFNFDNIDTIPYWYNSLGDFFNLSGLSIALLAEDFICDTWKFNGKVYEKNHVHTADNDWHLTHNDHGSIPQVENLQTYYEYHSMFCVAGKLLKTKKLEEKGWRNFEEWLSSYSTVWENKWLSDLRDSEPLLPIMHPIDKNNKSWNTEINWKEYEDYIGLHENKYLITNSSLYKYHWKDYENIHIESAFVSIEKAKSLIYALNDFENHHWYAIPLNEESEHSIDENGFILKGFHEEKVPSSDEGMDNHDTLANSIAKYVIIPGNIIKTHFNLETSEDFRFSYMPNNTKPITIFENWNDCSEKGYNEDLSSGHHFMIYKKSMLEILQKYKFCLLIECSVNRHKEKSSYKGKNKYTEFVSIYILYPNGKIESTNRNPKIREENY